MPEPTYVENMREIIAQLARKNAELESALNAATQRNMDQALRLAEAEKALAAFPRKYESTIRIERWLEEFGAALNAARKEAK